MTLAKAATIARDCFWHTFTAYRGPAPEWVTTMKPGFWRDYWVSIYRPRTEEEIMDDRCAP